MYTNTIRQLLENRLKLLRQEEEKENLVIIKKVKQELWKNWRNKMGGQPDAWSLRIESSSRMEKALEKIGKEVENYKKELEAEKEAADKRKDQMMRKR